MNLKFWEKEMEKDNIKIGIMDNDLMVGTTDFCLICLSPGYHFNVQDTNHFYIHRECFASRMYRGELVLRFKDANDVYTEKKDNISTVISLREKYKKYIEKRNKELKLQTDMNERI